METNWLGILIVTALAGILIIFILFRNIKDRKNLEKFLNDNEAEIRDNEDDELNDVI